LASLNSHPSFFSNRFVFFQSLSDHRPLSTAIAMSNDIDQSHGPSFLKGAKAPEGLANRFYVARHGDTVKYDENGTIHTQGWKVIDGEMHWYTQGGGNDNPLSEVGFAQARELAGLVNEAEIKQIVSSPLCRAVQTATLAQVSYIQMKIDPNLKECDYGVWERKFAPFAVFAGKDPDTEDSGIFSVRVAVALVHCRDPDTLLICHGNVIRVIAGLLGAHLSQADLKNAQLLRFDLVDGTWTITCLSRQK
jgi:broad specificity phosphatase PhoE